VESVEPSFLNRWNPSKFSSLPLRQQLESMDLPDYYKRRLAAAKTSDDIARLFYSIIAQGRRVRFKVKTTFRGEAPEEVWTDSGDCGYDFQVGETYLVYADEDEETDRINTSVCYRNRRLSDAGDDLAYLFFYKNGGDESARLEGFVTSDEFYQRDLDKAHDPEKVKLPAAGVILELNSGQGGGMPSRTATAGSSSTGWPEENTASRSSMRVPGSGQAAGGAGRFQVEKKGAPAGFSWCLRGQRGNSEIEEHLFLVVRGANDAPYPTRRGAGVSPAMPVCLPASEERRHGRRSGT